MSMPHSKALLGAVLIKDPYELGSVYDLVFF